MNTIDKHFHMRDGFTTFSLEPEKHSNLLFGERDREHRDNVLDGVHEGVLGGEGYKAVNYGDYGRGKTHQCYNLMHEISRRELPVKPIYVRCWEYKAKEPFHKLFGEMLSAIGTAEIQRAAVEYERKVQSGDATAWEGVLGSPEVATVFRTLSTPNPEVVRLAIRWLGGEPKLDTVQRGQIQAPSGLDIEVSRDFAMVLRGFAHLFATVDGEVLLYLIDESERLGQITHTDTYWSWTGSLRALTEIVGAGLIFFVGAKTRDDIPVMLTWDEVATRIGVTNYFDLSNPGYDSLMAWTTELLQTFVQKGPLPPAMVEALPHLAGDDSVASGIASVTAGDEGALAAYPFTAEALEILVDRCASDDLANKPREVLKRIQRAATRAARLDQELITKEVLEATTGDGI